MVKLHKSVSWWSGLGVSRHEPLSDFYLSSWQRDGGGGVMAGWRAALAAAALGILAWSLAEGAAPRWLIYLTNWGVLLAAATTTTALVLSLVFTCTTPPTPERSELPWLVRAYWVLFNVSVPISLMITALYWILLYNPELQASGGARALWLDVSTHGLTSCVLLAELLVSRTPVRLAHIYQPLALGLWYALFSLLYYAAGGTDAAGNQYIYEVLDWRQGARAAAVVAGAVVALFALYAALWGAARARDTLSARYVRHVRDVRDPSAPTPATHAAHVV